MNNSESSARLLNVNKDYIDSAILEGINNSSVQKFVFSTVNKSDNSEIDMNDFSNNIAIIMSMKSSVEPILNNNFSSTVLKKYGNKLTSALNDGISSTEVISFLQKTDDKNMGRTLEFISDIKSNEKSVSLNNKENVTQFQKVFVKKDQYELNPKK